MNKAKVTNTGTQANVDGKEPSADTHTNPQQNFQQAVKESAENMYQAINEVKSDPGYAGLSEDLRGRLDALITALDTTKNNTGDGGQSQ